MLSAITRSANAKMFENTMQVSSRKCQGFGLQCVFMKEKGCNDKSLVFPPPVYNCKHLHLCIVALTNKVIYDDVISPP